MRIRLGAPSYKSSAGRVAISAPLFPMRSGRWPKPGFAPTGVLFEFGVFLIFTTLFYGLPLLVQPMKARYRLSYLPMGCGRNDAR
jgi:hypothetical protein